MNFSISNAPLLKPTARPQGMRRHVVVQSTEGFTPEQLAFMERKKKRAAGEFVEIPNDNFCKSCNGTTFCPCHVCKGTGVNDDEKQEQARDYIYQSGAPTISPMSFRKGWACWLCKGGKQIPCGDCGGTGVVGGFTKYMTE